MIAASAVGSAPLSELTLPSVVPLKGETTGFAAVIAAVTPVSTAPMAHSATVTDAVPPEPVLTPFTSSKVETPLPAQVGVSSDGAHEIATPGGELLIAFAPATKVHAPQPRDQVAKPANTRLEIDGVVMLGESLPPRPETDQVVETMVSGAALLPEPQFSPTVPIADRPLPAPVSPALTTQIASAALPVATEITVQKPLSVLDRVDVSTAPPPETRGPIAPVQSTERVQPFAFERGPAFAPQIIRIARDFLVVASEQDVRFNVRPDVLGPVAVTIERTDAGSSLRLGVENQAAVQAVKHAEPMLHDARGQVSFVQVSVDLNAPDQRSRQTRGVVPQRRANDQTQEILTEHARVATGRYA